MYCSGVYLDGAAVGTTTAATTATSRRIVAKICCLYCALRNLCIVLSVTCNHKVSADLSYGAQ